MLKLIVWLLPIKSSFAVILPVAPGVNSSGPFSPTIKLSPELTGPPNLLPWYC